MGRTSTFQLHHNDIMAAIGNTQAERRGERGGADKNPEASEVTDRWGILLTSRENRK